MFILLRINVSYYYYVYLHSFQRNIGNIKFQIPNSYEKIRFSYTLREDIFARIYFREKIFSREDIFARRYFREKIFSREDIFANLGQIRENIFREIKVKLRIRENIFREIFSKMRFFQNTRKFSTVEKISLFFSENMRSSIITTKNFGLLNPENIFHEIDLLF